MMHHRIKKIRNLRRSRRLHWLNRFRRDDRGVQLVELAIVLPILLLLFAGVAEFGRYFYEYSTAARDISRQSAPEAAVPTGGRTQKTWWFTGTSVARARQF